MKKAWIDTAGTVVDVAHGVPADLFHPEVAQHYTTDVPDDVRPGARFEHGGWVNLPVVAAAPAPSAPAPTVGPNQFYFLWTMAEQVAIDSLRETDIGVKLFLRRLDDPRTTEVVLGDTAVQEAIRHTVRQLVAAGVIAAADAEKRAAAIIAGVR